MHPGRVLVAFIALLSAPPSAVAAVNCDAAFAEGQATARSIAVKLDASPYPKAGAPIRVAWTDRRNPQTARLQNAVYLVLTTAAEVRFAGKGFVALTAGADGPLNLAFGREGARALVPLHRLAEPGKGGELSVIPYQVGRQALSWAVVTAGPCGERVIDRNSTTIEVAAGPAELVVQDRFTAEAPARRIRSRTGTYDLLVFGQRYEVQDVATGAKIIDRTGIDPNFSPGGRFIAARRSSDGRFHVVDLVSRTEVEIGKNFFDGPVGLLAWARNDSYLLLAGLQYGELEVVNTIADNGAIISFNEGCHACRSWNDGQIILDLNRGFAALNQAGKGYAVDLSTRIHPAGDGTPARSLHDDLLADIRKSFDPAYPALPRVWEFGETLTLSHASASKFLAQETAAQSPFVVQHPVVPASAPAADGDQLTGQATGGRGFKRVAAAPAVPVASTPPQREKGAGKRTAPQAAAAAPRVEPTVAAKTIFDRMGALGVTTRAPLPIEIAFLNPETGTKAPNILKQSNAVAEKIRSSAAGTRALFRKSSECTFANTADDAVLVDPAYLSQVWRWRDADAGRWLMQTICKGGNAGFTTIDFYVAREGAATPTIKLPEFAGDAQDLKGEEDSQRGRVYHVADGLIALAVPLWSSATVVDLKAATRVGRPVMLADSALLSELRLTADARHLVQLNSDGRFFVHRIADGLRVLAGIHIDDEIVVMADDGRYDTTYEGALAVQVRFAGIRGLYTVQQFQATLYRQGLAAALLAGRDVAPARTLAAPPTAQLTLLPATKDGRRTGKIVATSERELAAVRLHVDGRLIREIPAKGRRAEAPVDLPEPGGGRWIAAIAVDAQGLASLPSAVQIPGPPLPRGTVHAVVVGVDAYEDSGIGTLASAKIDARNFARAIAAANGRAFKDVRTTMLLDAEVTPESVRNAALAAARAAGPEDTVVFYYAGHGIDAAALGKPDAGWLLTTNKTRLDDPGPTSVSWSALADIFGTSKGTVVVVLDSCHSGIAGREAFATNDAAVSALFSRTGAPMVVLAAAKGRQESLEFPNGGGGQFTTALVNAIVEGRSVTDRDRSGLVDLGELYAAVKARVLATSKGEQTPWLARNRLVGDMSLF